jgi:O-methyltransferase
MSLVLPVYLQQALERIKPEQNITGIGQVQQLIDDSSRKTLCDEEFFFHLNDVVLQLAEQNIAGDFVEAGVWRGGAAAFMKELIAFYNLQSNLWLADVFNTQNPGNKYEHQKDRDSLKIFQGLKGNILPDRKDVALFLNGFGNANTQINFLEGSIFNTLPGAEIKSISLLHIDVDFYEPTLFALEQLYEKVVPGGYIIIDDYGADVFNCKEAVDDFRSKNGISSPMQKMGAYPVAWKK